MKWWPVKSDIENPAYVSMHNFDKMQGMEKVNVHPTEFTQNNKCWKFVVQLAKSFSKYVSSMAKITHFEKTSFKLMATEIVKISPTLTRQRNQCSFSLTVRWFLNSIELIWNPVPFLWMSKKKFERQLKNYCQKCLLTISKCTILPRNTYQIVPLRRCSISIETF